MNQKKRRRRKNRKLRRAILMIFVLAVLIIFAICVWQLWLKKDEVSTSSYPMEYEDLIRQYAGENDLDPAYVAAVILAESSYRSDAVSSANAQGLMQILPDTAKWIASKLDETYEDRSLFDPEFNNRYGCSNLTILKQRYDNDMSSASAAYHQGQGTVDRWLEDPELSSDGRTLDNFDSSTTETYVKRILSYYEKYEELYA